MSVLTGPRFLAPFPLREIPSLTSSSFWRLHVLFGVQLYNSNLCSYLYMAFSSVSTHSPLLSFIRTALIGFTAHLDNPRWSHLEILNLITSAKTLFLNKVPIHRFQGLRHGHIILGATDQHTTHGLVRSTLFSIQISGGFPDIFLLLIFHLIPL